MSVEDEVPKPNPPAPPEAQIHIKMLNDVYFDAVSTIRHYDTQRSSFATISLSGFAGLTAIAAIYAKGEVNQSVFQFLSMLGFILSVLACVVMAKFDRLIRRQRTRAKTASTFLEKDFSIGVIEKVDFEVNAREQHKLFTRIQFSWLWICVFSVFSACFLAASFVPRLVLN